MSDLVDYLRDKLGQAVEPEPQWQIFPINRAMTPLGFGRYRVLIRDEEREDGWFGRTFVVWGRRRAERLLSEGAQ